MVTELEPIYDSRASFYGKAQVEFTKSGDRILYSYGTKVVTITKAGDVQLHDDWDSSLTTVRHVREFLLQNNKLAGPKRAIAQRYLK